MTLELELVGLNRFDRVITITNHKPVSAKNTEKITDVIRLMIDTEHRRLPIVSKHNELEGIISNTDIVDAILRNQNLQNKIDEIMVRNTIFCNDSDTLGSVLQRFKLSRRGGFPIIDRKKLLLGMIVERDFVSRFSNTPFNIKVEDVMTKKPFVINLNNTVLECAKRMVNTKYRRLPVKVNDKLFGIVTMVDILKFLHDNHYSVDKLDAPMINVVKKETVSVSKDQDLSAAIKKMSENKIGGVLVVEGNKLEGILTERDILEEII